MISHRVLNDFSENKAFSPSYDLGPPPPPPLSPVSELSLFLSLPVCRRSSLLKGEGEEPNNTTATKSLILYKSFNTRCDNLNSRARGLRGLPPLMKVVFQEAVGQGSAERSGVPTVLKLH